MMVYYLKAGAIANVALEKLPHRPCDNKRRENKFDIFMKHNSIFSRANQETSLNQGRVQR